MYNICIIAHFCHVTSQRHHEVNEYMRKLSLNVSWLHYLICNVSRYINMQHSLSLLKLVGRVGLPLLSCLWQLTGLLQLQSLIISTDLMIDLAGVADHFKIRRTNKRCWDQISVVESHSVIDLWAESVHTQNLYPVNDQYCWKIML